MTKDNSVDDIHSDGSKILVAVYGTLKRTFHNHHLISQSEHWEFLGTDFTTGVLTHLSGYPGAVRARAGKIRIEVFSIDAACLGRLDILEGHPTFFRRSIVETAYGKAWMYFVPANRYFSGKVKIIEDGEWLGSRTTSREFRVSQYMHDGDAPRFLLKSSDPRPRLTGEWTIVPIDDSGTILTTPQRVPALPPPPATQDQEDKSLWPKVSRI